jgi:hypothetical protein
MRGRIIHYNGADGKGLISAGQRQFPFEITHWRSDTAPSINQTVDLSFAGDVLENVTRVTDDVLLKEKAEHLAGKLGSAGGAALQSLRDATPAGMPGAPAGAVQLLGKPLLVAHGLFVFAALLLPFLTINPLGLGGKSFTLAGLAEASEAMGTSVGGAVWVWLAILSIALPVFWRHRMAWLALLLPLFAAIKPGIDLAFAASKATSALGNSFEAQLQRQIVEQLIDALQVGFGAWVCVIAALAVALIGIKRFLLPPTA